MTETPPTIPAAPPALPQAAGATRVALGLAVVLILTGLIGKAASSLGPTTLVEIGLTLIGAAVAAAAALAAPTPRRPWGAFTLLALAALTAWTALSVIWSVAPDLTWNDANRALAYLAVFAGTIGLARLLPWRPSAILSGVLIASVALSLIALALKAYPLVFNSTEELARLRDPLDYWNALGLIAAFAIPPCLWLGARREGGPALRALAYPLLGLSVVVVALSYSRGVLIAVAVGVAFWFAVVPLRLRGLVVGLIGGAGGVAVSVWAFNTDALSKDRQSLAHRVDAGHDLALFCVLMIAVLFVAGLVINRYGDTHPLTDRWRGRVGLGAVAAGVVAVLALLAVLSVTGGGLGDRASRAWDNFFSTTKASTTYGPERLKSIGTRRGSYWDEAKRVWEAHKVLGAGSGGYAVARKRYRKDPIEVQHAHGYVPQTAADLGLVGLGLSLLVFLAWIAATARTLGGRALTIRSFDPRRLRGAPAALGRLGARVGRLPAGVEAVATRGAPRRPVNTDRVALLTLVTVVVMFGTHSLIDWTWLVPVTAVAALVCAGYLAGRGPLGVPGPAQTRRVSARVTTAVSVAVMALAAVWAIWQPLRSDKADDAALAALSDGRKADALVQAREAHSRNPLALQPLYDISTIEDAAGRKDLAQKALEQAVKLQPANPDSWSQLANYQLNVLNQPSVAFQSARAALFLDPKSPDAQALFLDAYRKLPRRQVQPGKSNGKSNSVLQQLSKLGQGGSQPNPKSK